MTSADLTLQAARVLATDSADELAEASARRMASHAVLAAAAHQRRSEQRQMWSAVAMATVLGCATVAGSRMLAAPAPVAELAPAPAVATAPPAEPPPRAPAATEVAPAAVAKVVVEEREPGQAAALPATSPDRGVALPATPETARASRPQPARRAAQRALRQGAMAPSQTRAAWYLVLADAEERLGRFGPAAQALEAAAAYRTGHAARDLAYRAALIHFERLDDPARALHVLRAAGVTGPTHFVDRRSAELRVRALVALDRPWEARAVARFYLRKFSGTRSEAYLRSVAGPT